MDLITTPAVFGQSPPADSIVHSTSVSLTSRSPSEPVHLVQYDDTLPIVAVALTANGQPYTVPSGAAVNVRMAKPDGTYVYNPAYGVSTDGQIAYIAITVQMTVCAGKVAPIIEVVLNGDVAGTGFFVLDIDPNPIPEDAIESTDEYKTIQKLAAEVTVAANIIAQNIDAINTAAQNIEAIQQAPQQASNAAASATLSQSWAVGGTGTREGEDTNNAKYWSVQSAGQSVHLYKATFLAEGWSSSAPYSQTVALNGSSNAPSVNSNSEFMSAAMLPGDLSGQTDVVYASALVASGSFDLGSDTITCTVDQKPSADVELYFSIKRV